MNLTIAREAEGPASGDRTGAGQTDAAFGRDERPGSRSEVIPTLLPILPVRGVVLFPASVVPVALERASSLELLDRALVDSKIIGVVTQRISSEDNPGPEHLYRVGTAARVLKLLRQSEEGAVVLLHGLQR